MPAVLAFLTIRQSVLHVMSMKTAIDLSVASLVFLCFRLIGFWCESDK